MVFNGVEVLEKDGAVAVLISPGYGAGWSTWNDNKIAYDKRVVEYFDAHPPKLSLKELDEAEEYLASIGYPETYMGGYNQLVKEWISIGEPFMIREYDGSEKIVTTNEFIMFK